MRTDEQNPPDSARKLLLSRLFPMPIFLRLLLGHTLPVAFVSLALGLTLMALLRMTALLESVTHGEMRTVQVETEVHHAIWRVDAAIGSAYAACQSSGPVAKARLGISEKAQTLSRVLSSHPLVSTELKDNGSDWLALASDIRNSQHCELLGSSELRSQRDALDDQLTDLWSQRLDVLHEAVAQKDDEAGRIGQDAVRVGGVIAAAACALALLLARHLARTFNRPLKRLSLSARKVGAGDFSSAIAVEGPAELRHLANEFERMRLKLEQLEQLKQGFLASVSHELRTPLSKLREALALLEDGVVGALSPAQLKVTKIARAACEREIRMVSTLLDLSRLRAGSPIRPRAGRMLDDVIRKAADEELSESADRGVGVHLDLDGATPLCSIDPDLLERSIANLLRNAIAVSQSGQQVTVRRCLTTRAQETWVQVTVSDEGPGVPQEIQDSVFLPFVTSSVPHSPKAIGIGLGLALAREVAVAHGGDLVLDPQAPGGATFHLYLPLARQSLSVPPRQKDGSADTANLPN